MAGTLLSAGRALERLTGQVAMTHRYVVDIDNSDSQLGEWLVRLCLIGLPLRRRRRIVVARTADHRSEKDEQEGKSKAGEPDADTLSATAGGIGHSNWKLWLSTVQCKLVP